MNPILIRALSLPVLRRLRNSSPAPWMLAAVLLTAAIGSRFTRLPEPPRPGYQPATLTDEALQAFVRPIQNEVRENEPGRIVTASAIDGVLDSGAISSGPDDATISEQRYRNSIAGLWEDEYRGKRHLTVRGDGTGTMVVEPDGIGKKLFAPRLTFDLVWSLDDDKITMKLLHGEPKSKVQLILKLYGQEAEYTIRELTGDRMLLLDPDGKTEYDWRRPASPSVE